MQLTRQAVWKTAAKRQEQSRKLGDGQLGDQFVRQKYEKPTFRQVKLCRYTHARLAVLILRTIHFGLLVTRAPAESLNAGIFKNR